MSELKVTKTSLEGVLLIEPPTIFEDHRGNYVETYNEKMYNDAGIRQKFVQDGISVSLKNVLRGIHGNTATWKLVSAFLGSFYLVIVDCNPDSPGFCQWESFNLSDENYLQVLIPPMYGIAHLALSDKGIFSYKQTSYYERSTQFTYRYNDVKFNIDWPIKEPVLSKRDSSNG